MPGSEAQENMSSLNLFGLFAVSVMVISYALESRHSVFVLVFAMSCVFTSVYGFMQGAWPFGIVEAVWSGIAVRRWWKIARHNVGPADQATTTFGH
jgi:hypothetical protein